MFSRDAQILLTDWDSPSKQSCVRDEELVQMKNVMGKVTIHSANIIYKTWR